MSILFGGRAHMINNSWFWINSAMTNVVFFSSIVTKHALNLLAHKATFQLIESQSWSGRRMEHSVDIINMCIEVYYHLGERGGPNIKNGT